MTIPETIYTIQKAAKKVKLTELARRSGVPYTTLRDWEKKGWRTPHIDAFEDVAKAAEDVLKGRASTPPDEPKSPPKEVVA